jgi:hypothetical protein
MLQKSPGRRVLMTPFFDPSRPSPGAGLFRTADHIVILPSGSTLTILDLDQGLCYASTPLGADGWRMLVGKTEAPQGSEQEKARGAEDDDGRAWVRVAAYMLDRRIIEPAL